MGFSKSLATGLAFPPLKSMGILSLLGAFETPSLLKLIIIFSPLFVCRDFFSLPTSRMQALIKVPFLKPYCKRSSLIQIDFILNPNCSQSFVKILKSSLEVFLLNLLNIDGLQQLMERCQKNPKVLL